jgi:hypothetical protein
MHGIIYWLAPLEPLTMATLWLRLKAPQARSIDLVKDLVKALMDLEVDLNLIQANYRPMKSFPVKVLHEFLLEEEAQSQIP